MYKIVLSNGKTLDNCELNGNCYVTDEAVDDNTFAGMKSAHIFLDNALVCFIKNAKLVTVQSYPPDRYLFALVEISADENRDVEIGEMQDALVELAELIGG